MRKKTRFLFLMCCAPGLGNHPLQFIDLSFRAAKRAELYYLKGKIRVVSQFDLQITLKGEPLRKVERVIILRNQKLGVGW